MAKANTKKNEVTVSQKDIELALDLAEKESAIRSGFDIANEELVEHIATALVTHKAEAKATENKSEAFRQTAELLDYLFDSKWLDAKFAAVKEGCKDLAAGFTKIAGEVDLTINQVKELHQVYLALATDKVGGNRQVWQNIKFWSRFCTDPKKAKHPDAKEALEEAKAEAEANETADDAVEKVVKILVSQYQYLGKIEEANPRVNLLMQDLGDVLVTLGIDIEKI